MRDHRVEAVARRLCAANGIGPDDPMLVPDNDRGGEEAPMWLAYERAALEHIAAFDYLALELLGGRDWMGPVLGAAAKAGFLKP